VEWSDFYRFDSMVGIQITKRRYNACGNDAGMISRMKKMSSEIGCAVSFENTKVKNCCRKSCTAAAANCASSLLESQLKDRYYSGKLLQFL
jgi:hypothetical protein